MNFTYFITCNLEFDRYFTSKDADDIYHAYGGQDRLDFYLDLFAGRLDYELILDLIREPGSLELGLAEKGILRHVAYFIPDRYRIFKHIGTDSADDISLLPD